VEINNFSKCTFKEFWNIATGLNGRVAYDVVSLRSDDVIPPNAHATSTIVGVNPFGIIIKKKNFNHYHTYPSLIPYFLFIE
jgi:hypothetical protein